MYSGSVRGDEAAKENSRRRDQFGYEQIETNMRKQTERRSRDHVLNYFLSLCQIDGSQSVTGLDKTRHAWKGKVAKIQPIDIVFEL